MKLGQTLQDLSTEIMRQKDAKRDFLVDSQALSVQTNGATNLKVGDEEFKVTDWTHGQIREVLQIPGEYYSRLRTKHPELLDTSVNYLLSKQTEKRMVRTLDGNARALVSDRYRRLDHAELLEGVLPYFGQLEGLQFRSVQVTDQKLYLKVTLESLTRALRVGDTVRGGLVISNSEIGGGSVRVDPFVETLRCVNGMIISEFSMRRAHIGRKVKGGDAEDNLIELYSDETLEADDRAFFLKFRDTVSGLLTEEVFEKITRRLEDAGQDKIATLDVVKVVELAAKRYSLVEEEKESVLAHLIGGGDLTRYGLANAITRTAEDARSYDRATQLEALGGTVITLSPSEWSVVAETEETPKALVAWAGE